MVYRAPGVYIKEISTFVRSVGEVEAAIPAFIGYTENAAERGETFINKPWRIKRCFFNMVEESVKKSTHWAVFEPNAAALWNNVKVQVELTSRRKGVWERWQELRRETPFLSGWGSAKRCPPGC